MSSTFNKYRLKGAYHYDWYKTEDWYRECVDECVKFCKGITVDVGCGDGLLLSKLPKGSFGLDSDPNALEICRANGQDVVSLDLDDDSATVLQAYDYVASINTIEHLNSITALMNLVKAANKGAIIITNQYLGGSLGEDHKHEYDYGELLDIFKEFNPKGFKTKDGLYIGVEIKK